MSYNIEKVQQELLGTNFLEENSQLKAQVKAVNTLLDDYVKRFLNELDNQYNTRDVAAGGNLVSSAQVDIFENGRVIKLPYYYDFPNKGVKGWGSSKNAPSSPYQFKKGVGMSEEGKQSIRAYIESGKQKSTITKSYTAVGSIEKKGKKISNTDPIEQAVGRAVWMIKKYGIKTNPYFDIAYNMVFKDFTQSVSSVYGVVAEVFIKANLEAANQQQQKAGKLKSKKK